jgi:hypothetical protein
MQTSSQFANDSEYLFLFTVFERRNAHHLFFIELARRLRITGQRFCHRFSGDDDAAYQQDAL